MTIFAIAVVGGAQPAKDDPSSSDGTQERGYWVDPETKLMWAAKDSGKDLTWRKARSYCCNLQLSGYHDWGLGTLDELATLVDKVNSGSLETGNTQTFEMNVGRYVRGSLLLNGDPWSSNQEKDRFGHAYGPGWFFDFATGKPSYDLQLFRNVKYALCVRASRA